MCLSFLFQEIIIIIIISKHTTTTKSIDKQTIRFGRFLVSNLASLYSTLLVYLCCCCCCLNILSGICAKKKKWRKISRIALSRQVGQRTRTDIANGLVASTTNKALSPQLIVNKQTNTQTHKQTTKRLICFFFSVNFFFI